MTKLTLRYAQYLSSVRLRQRALSYNTVLAGEAQKRVRARLRPKDFYRLIGPYVGVRFTDQFRAVVPLALFLVVFALLILHATVRDEATVAAGVLAVIVGLMLFLEGIHHGLMPYSETIGYNMPSRTSSATILGVAFVLGVAATFAEPALAALKTVGSLTDRSRAPYLHALLNDHPLALVLAVAVSVGLAVLVGILRLAMNWRLKTLIVLSLVPCLALTGYLAMSPDYAPLLGLAWDCGAITTGPVTVPMVVAMGVGVAAATGKEDNPLSGFGIVTLASLFPAVAIMLLGLLMPAPQPAAIAIPLGGAVDWYAASPWSDLIAALRAILPLTCLLWLTQRMWIKEPMSNPKLIAYGIGLSVLGMLLFNLGLAYGLTPLGNDTGTLLPAAFAPYAAVAGSPIYTFWVGVAFVVGFALLLGFGATIAEPALSAMGVTVENLTDGAFRKDFLVHTVAVGVGLGTAAGVIKVIFDLPFAALLIPAYVIALIMTLVSGEEYVNLAWDSAGVTTGPVTVPLILAMGLGLGQAVQAAEGFGILALASAGPIISVLAAGLWIRWRLAKSRGNNTETTAA
ncbi:MAG: hypothetical protein A3F74_16265 [Betaproteobacteria bacterium RIFCSPLOWO2_12_FULL_62_58]|nr:MAG: hypothetical protein A3I62_01980 [Betaproteobacteria bacterium RIFCSPLOWO2_02_FULL_62_79]OGA50007.1 MAG: hypothetical protein A3F74_16265 [Betaproteobacteria bacterium RIFCSPLOWO2_12_FULL_62_58]